MISWWVFSRGAGSQAWHIWQTRKLFSEQTYEWLAFAVPLSDYKSTSEHSAEGAMEHEIIYTEYRKYIYFLPLPA